MGRRHKQIVSGILGYSRAFHICRSEGPSFVAQCKQIGGLQFQIVYDPLPQFVYDRNTSNHFVSNSSFREFII